MEDSIEIGDIIERPLEDMQSAVVSGVYSVWLSKCGLRAMPMRKDLSPRLLKQYLPHLHLFDVKGADRFRVRLCGTAIARALGKDTTGVELTTNDPSILIRRTVSVLKRVLVSKAPVLVFTERGAAPGTRVHRAESVWLPLADSNSTVDQILTATAIELLPAFVQSVPLK